jgi:hypothetical protein
MAKEVSRTPKPDLLDTNSLLKLIPKAGIGLVKKVAGKKTSDSSGLSGRIL